MTWRELNALVPEYTTVLALAGHEGWLAPLLRAHLRPCTKGEAEMLLRAVGLNRLPVTWRPGSGRARHGEHGYRISLPPTVKGWRGHQLRAGLVLHEAAHVLDHRRRKQFGHGLTFCKHFRRLIESDWPAVLGASYKPGYKLTLDDEGRLMVCHSFSEIYSRHRGPYSLVLTRETRKAHKGEEKITHSTDKVRGPLGAEEAHEEARMIVNDPRDNVIDAHVFSETEQQFIGAHYARGVEVLPWDDARSFYTDASAEPVGLTPLPGPVTIEGTWDAPPVIDLMDALKKALPPSNPHPPSPVDVAYKFPVEPAGKPVTASPKKRGVALMIDDGYAEPWPKSPAAQLIRDYLSNGRKASAKEIGSALADQMTVLGVEFPTALVSRMKQAGMLKEAE